MGITVPVSESTRSCDDVEPGIWKPSGAGVGRILPGADIATGIIELLPVVRRGLRSALPLVGPVPVPGEPCVQLMIELALGLGFLGTLPEGKD